MQARNNTYNMRRIPGFRSEASNHEPISSKERLNWSIFGAWILILFACLGFWAGVAASLIQVYSWLQ